MKKCLKCLRLLPITEYHKDKSRASGLREKCKDCRCKYEKIVKKKCVACGDDFEVSGLSKGQKYCGKVCQRVHIRYGIDEYKLEDLLIRSNYKCSICGEDEVNIDKRTGKIYELSIDHNHNTGEVRGVLCTNCNAGLGHFKDNIDSLKKAISYIKNNGL
jgi:hypothetical protein